MMKPLMAPSQQILLRQLPQIVLGQSQDLDSDPDQGLVLDLDLVLSGRHGPMIPSEMVME